MPTPQLHPEATTDPRVLRWVTGPRQLPDRPAELAALVDGGVLDRVEVGSGEVRTRLGANRSWAIDGPEVRTALLAALAESEHRQLDDDELASRIADILQSEVAPIATSHGGDVTVDSVRDGVLTVEMSGACRGCSLKGRTIEELVTRSVRARYPQIREVRTATQRRVWLTLSRRREGR